VVRHNWLRIGSSVVLSICLAGLVKGGDGSITSLPAEKGEKKLSTFDYRGITLNSGWMRAQIDEVCDEYLRIPNDIYQCPPLIAASAALGSSCGSVARF